MLKLRPNSAGPIAVRRQLRRWIPIPVQELLPCIAGIVAHLVGLFGALADWLFASSEGAGAALGCTVPTEWDGSYALL